MRPSRVGEHVGLDTPERSGHPRQAAGESRPDSRRELVEHEHVCKVYEVGTGNNPGVRQLVADLAMLEAHSLDKAQGADAKRKRADAIATARRELEAALASNPLLETKVRPKLKQLDST